jgi:thiol-disulfide isomerase/thioredoxin
MKIILSFIIALLLDMSSVIAQDRKSLIGTQFPFDQRIEINGTMTSLSRYKGKPLIVELFTSSCIVCFRMMPKVNELNIKFRDKVQFLLIGNEKNKLPDIYKRFKERLSLTMDAGFDSALYSSFHVPSVPRYFWIDAMGIIRIETSTDSITEEQVLSFLNSSYNAFNREKLRKKFDKSASLPGFSDIENTGVIYRTQLSRYADSLTPYIPLKLSLSAEGRLQIVNCVLSGLYRYAYFAQYDWYFGDSLYGKVASEPIIEKGTINFDKESLKQHYCYGVYSFSPRSKEVLQQALQNDLQNVFGFTSHTETRKMPYWALVRSDSTQVDLRSQLTKRKYHYHSYSGFWYQCVPVSEVLFHIAYPQGYGPSSIPFIDETGISYPIDIRLDAVLTDIDDVKRELAKSGLALIQKEKEMTVIVIKDFKKGN